MNPFSVSSPVHFIRWATGETATKPRSPSTAKPPAFCPREYDVDPKTGFCPPQPLPRLPAQFSEWEEALADAPQMLALSEDASPEALAKRRQGEAWRNRVQSWPVMSTTTLHDDLPTLQRAHMVLASLMHYYVHSTPQTDSSIPIMVPRSIAIPLVAVSRELRMAPALTFADTVLWNWEFIDDTQPLSPENMRYVNIFSGTETERNFYLASAAVELRGVEMLDIIDSFMNLRNCTDSPSTAVIARDLLRLSKIIDDLSSILQSVRDTVDPQTFYWQVRPWWSGNSSRSTDHPGWILEGVPNSAQLDLAGASAGQSSVMHAVDIFLDIDHKLRENRTPLPSTENRKGDTGFMERMRRYMPGLHREYLENLRSVRGVVERTPCLKAPYDAAVLALKRLRDAHIRIVAVYVISKSHSTPPPHFQGPSSVGAAKGLSKGTGGSDVSKLLKAGRDATQRAAFGEN